jgi:DNA-directed RNA polymerase subunit L
LSKLVTIKTRVTQTEAQQLTERAQSEDRSLASLLRQIIREKLSTKEASA